MKAITIKQPWASLIVDGVKDIENRTWPTNYRGLVLVHSSKAIDIDAVYKISCIDGELARKVWHDLNDNKYPTGAIIGTVNIIDCYNYHTSPWAEIGCYNWVLANPVKFDKPILNVKGKLSFWNYNL